MSTAATSIKPLGDKLVGVVRQLLSGGHEDAEHPPGPWDTVIRAAVQRTFSALHATHGSNALAWHPYGERSIADAYAAADPQPLPPRMVFAAAIASEVIGRATFVQEIVDTLPRDEERRGIIIVGGYVAKFVDDVCGAGFRIRFPFPPPTPPWFARELDGTDLIVIGAQFQIASGRAFRDELRRVFAEAASEFQEAGLERI